MWLLVQDLYDPTQLSRTAQRTWIMFHPLQSEVWKIIFFKVYKWSVNIFYLVFRYWFSRDCDMLFAHVRRLDFWSGEPFFKICFWWKNPLPSTLRCPRRLLYQYSRAIWSILEVLNAIFCIFVQALLRKLEVIQKNCTKAYYLLSVFLQTDQMWHLMWSSGFHFCLLSSPFNDLPFSARF